MQTKRDHAPYAVPGMDISETIIYMLNTHYQAANQPAGNPGRPNKLGWRWTFVRRVQPSTEPTAAQSWACLLPGLMSLQARRQPTKEFRDEHERETSRLPIPAYPAAPG